MLWQLPTSHSLLSTCVCQGSVYLSVAIGQTVWQILCANCLTDVEPAGNLLYNITKSIKISNNCLFLLDFCRIFLFSCGCCFTTGATSLMTAEFTEYEVSLWCEMPVNGTVVFHWVAGWNVLIICCQCLVNRGILEGAWFRFSFFVDLLCQVRQKAFLWMVRSVNFLHLRNIGRKMLLFPQIRLSGARLFSSGQSSTERRRLIKS